MVTGLSILLVLFYIALLAIYIYLIVLFVRMSNDVKELRSVVNNMAFRDTARYISEVESGKIPQGAQDQAEREFTT